MLRHQEEVIENLIHICDQRSQMAAITAQMESALREKDDAIRDLRADCTLLLEKLAKAAKDLASERDRHATDRLAWNSQKQAWDMQNAALDREIAELGTKLFVATSKLSSGLGETESKLEDALDQRDEAQDMLTKAEAAIFRHQQQEETLQAQVNQQALQLKAALQQNNRLAQRCSSSEFLAKATLIFTLATVVTFVLSLM